MKIIKESVNIDSIKVGDMITYDSNYIGVTPKIHKGEVVRIEKGYGSKGDPRPPKIFVVKSDLGKLVKVDETDSFRCSDCHRSFPGNEYFG